MKKNFIENFRMLATDRARNDALSIIEAGFASVDTGRAVRKAVSVSGNILEAGGRKYDLRKYDRVYVVGVGKASFDAASALEEVVGKRIDGGIVLDVKKGKLRRLKSYAGTHPLPSQNNIAVTKKIIELVETVGARDLLIVIVSGGGSALLCKPLASTCNGLKKLTSALMRKGANIREMNTIRKHASGILGGQLARLAYPATVIGLVFSDVPGDDIGMVASGPTVLDRTTVRDAERVIAKYGILDAPLLVETPKDRKFFKRVQNVLVVSNKVAAQAMLEQAKKLKYAARIYSTTASGEARKLGVKLAKMPKPGEAVIAVGETTVTVAKDGVGGRNQETVLGALGAIKGNQVVISCASDGIDHTPAAGAIGDLKTIEAAKRLNLDPAEYLENNSSYDFFKKVRAHIQTGITGINISDMMLSLRPKK